MKKRYIALIVLAALIVIVFAALKVAPGIAKNYIVNHSEEIIGRKMKIENVEFSPFSFTVTVDDFAIYEPDGTTPFVAFEKFRINVNPTHLIKKEISVSEIYLKGLYTRVAQKGDKFNFSDILDKFATDSTADSTTAKEEAAKTAPAIDSAQALNLDPNEMIGFSVALENITLEKGNIIYEDLKVGSKIHIQDFSVAIPAVYFSNKDTDIGVNLKFANGGDLGVKVQFNMKTQDFGVNVTLNKLALSVAKPYLNDFINYKDFKGTLSVNMNLAGNLNDILSSNIKGTVSVDGIELTETSGRSLGVNHVGVGIARANINENSYHVDSVVVDGAFAHIDLYKNGKTNIDVLLKKGSADEPDSAQLAADQQLVIGDIDTLAVDSTAQKAEEEEAEPAKKLKAKIDRLIVQNTKASATDHSITRPFNYTVSAITVNGSNINFDTPCAINVSAAFPEGGKLSVKYKGALNNLGTMDAYISVKNLALKHFSNYSHHYTGYPLSAGTLAFASENKIKNFELDSKNTIDIYNIDVADKDPNSNPEFTVPMKVGLYILKDKDDKIQFDIPVHGNMKDPQFSIGKIIWKTVMNLLIKVAISPLKIVGNIAATGAGAIGLDLGKNDEVIIDATSTTFTSEQYAKATKMTEVLAKDKNLKLVFTQFYSPRKTADAYRTVKLKTDYYKKTHGKEKLTELDERAIAEMKDSDEGFQAYVKENGDKIDAKALRTELAALAKKRNEDLLKVLTQQKGVTKKNVQVITAPAGALGSYRGKPMYKVTIDVQ